MKNILMNTDMAKAILDGRKVQTRRVIKNMRKDNLYEDYFKAFIDAYAKYKVGETVWVREPARVTRCDDILRQYDYQYLADGFNRWQQDIPKRIQYNHTNAFLYPNKYGTWLTKCQGIPNGCIKEMARIFLKVTNVRVERLQDISDCEFEKEGICTHSTDPYDSADYCAYYGEPDWENHSNIFSDFHLGEPIEQAFIHLWNSTAPKGYEWEDNPYVFVYEFERIEEEIKC